MNNFTESLTIRVLGRMLDRIAGQVQALSRTRITIPDGSFLNCLSGSNRVATMLTRDKVVIREPAGSELGAWFLDALDRDVQPRPETRASATSPRQETVNNFGGISIHVREASDVNTVVRDLRFQGLQLRNRRG